jgi:hypothetical protein
MRRIVDRRRRDVTARLRAQLLDERLTDAAEASRLVSAPGEHDVDVRARRRRRDRRGADHESGGHRDGRREERKASA